MFLPDIFYIICQTVAMVTTKYFDILSLCGSAKSTPAKLEIMCMVNGMKVVFPHIFII